MWFTEIAWPPILVFVSVAVALGCQWWQRQQAKYLLLTAVCLLAAVGTFVIEAAIVTPLERIESGVFEITSAFQAKDKDRTLGQISEGFAAMPLKALAAGAIDAVDVSPGFRVTDLKITLTNENSRAVSKFRVNGQIKLKGNDLGHQPTMFQATWQIEADEWRMVDIKELDPITSEPIDRFHMIPRGQM